ncbi:carbonic anhydrase [Nemania sp. FL0916]|nr:carbonic anhydrase [Nemania sp. FL0916]
MSFASELLKRAEATAKSHQPIPYFSEMKVRPQVKMIFCCFDMRVKPEQFLGLTPNDPVLIVRSASGTPARNILEIAALDHFVGINELIVVKHTDCGATHMTDEGIKSHILSYSPELESTLASSGPWTNKDIIDAGHKDVELIKSSPLIRKELRDTASALLFDIKTGEVTKIV